MRILAAALALASSLNALGQPRGHLRPVPAPSAAASVLATLTRTGGGFGGGPIYSVSISADGTVQYKGESGVGVIGVRMTRLTPEQLARLVAAFDTADYFSLRDRYEGGPTDNSYTITSFSRGGRTKRVSHYMSTDAGAPRALFELENAIDAIAGTREWVYLSPEEEKRREREKATKYSADRDALRAQLPALKTQLRDPSADVRRRAALAILVGRGYQLVGPTELAEVAPVIGEAVTHASPAVRKEAAQQLIAFGPEARGLVPALTSALADPDPYIRGQAAGALFRIGRPAVVSTTSALERALHDPDPNVRGEAARALPALGFSFSRVLEILITDLRSPDEQARFAAATALGYEGPNGRSALPALRQALSDPAPRVRDAARRAVKSIEGTP
jgi:HEAT repeat protein